MVELVAYVLNVTSSSVQILYVNEFPSNTMDVIVTYKVIVQRTVFSAEAYMSVLAVSVSSGQFTQLLRAKAKQLNITAFELASSSYYAVVTNAPTGTPSRYPTNNSPETQYIGFIVGIIVGGAVFLLCVVIGFYYYFCVNNGSKQRRTPVSDTNRVNMRQRSEGGSASAAVVERHPSLVDL